jgi:E3 Ubiquitin ligase
VHGTGIGQMTLAMAFFRASGPPASLLFWPLAEAAAGVYLFCHGFFLLQRKRLIMNTPVSKVRSAAMGLVEISGLASGPYSLTAPITGAPCYYCRTIVWRWKREGRGSKWVKAADENLHVPFYLEDNTGRVLVDPQGAELDIHRDFHDEFNQGLFVSSFGMPPNMSSFLLTHGFRRPSGLKSRNIASSPRTRCSSWGRWHTILASR